MGHTLRSTRRDQLWATLPPFLTFPALVLPLSHPPVYLELDRNIFSAYLARISLYNHRTATARMIPEGLQDDTVDDSTDYSDGGYSQLIADYNEDDTQETIVVPPSLEAPKRASTPEPTKQEIPVALGKRTFAEARLAESPSSNARSPKKQHMSNVKLPHSTSPSTPRRSMVDIVTDALREQPDTNNASSSSRRQSVPNAIIEARRPEPRTPSHNTGISPSSRPSDSRYPDHRSSANKASIETPESLPLPHIPRPSSPENQMPVASEFPPFEIVASHIRF